MMIDKKKPVNVKRGKASRAAGARFEKRVRADLEKQGFVVDRWTNNVSDFPESNINLPPEERVDRKLIPAKPKFIFNPKTKTRMMIGNNSGFPDFICTRKLEFGTGTFEVEGCEVKSNGYLSKEEKEKCQWLLDNHVFGKILIASKSKEKRGEIIYKEFGK